MRAATGLGCALLILLGASAPAFASGDEIPPDEPERGTIQIQPAPRPAPVPAPAPRTYPAPAPMPPPVRAVVYEPAGPPWIAGHVDGYFIPWAEYSSSIPGFLDVDGDGFGVKAFVQILEYFILNTELEFIGMDRDLDVFNYRIGPGLGFNPTRNSTLYALAQFIGTEFDGPRTAFEPGDTVDHEEGWGVHGGFKAWTTRCWGFEGQAGWVELENFEGPEFTLGAFAQLFRIGNNSLGIFADFRTQQFDFEIPTAFGDVEHEVDTDEARVGVRFNFSSPRSAGYLTCG
jgi:hypothetical protein